VPQEQKNIAFVVPKDFTVQEHLNIILKAQYSYMNAKFTRSYKKFNYVVEKFEELQNEELQNNMKNDNIDIVIMIDHGNYQGLEKIQNANTRFAKNLKNLTLPLKEGSKIILLSCKTGRINNDKQFDDTRDGIGETVSNDDIKKTFAYCLAKDNTGVEVIAPCTPTCLIMYENKPLKTNDLGVRFIQNNLKPVNYIKLLQTKEAMQIKLRQSSIVPNQQTLPKKQKWSIMYNKNDQIKISNPGQEGKESLLVFRNAKEIKNIKTRSQYQKVFSTFL
jgi:hypothetical protein